MEQDIFERRRQALKDFLYLPLFYLIPDEIAQKRKLDSFPRDPYLVATTKEWVEVYNSKWFQAMLLDTWGWMMWQCLGIRGGVDNYSKNDPFVLMTFSLLGAMFTTSCARKHAERNLHESRIWSYNE